MFFFKFIQRLSHALIERKSFSPEELIKKQTQDMYQQYSNYEQRLDYSLPRLKAYRNHRLRQLLHYAKKYSPWYQKELASTNLDYFSESNLSDLTPMNKFTLMKHWDEIVTDRRLNLKLVEQHISKMNERIDSLYLLNEYHVLASSGSSGTRGVYVYNWDEWIAFHLNARRCYRQSKAPNGHKKIVVAQVVITNTVYGMYSNAVSFLNEQLERFYFPVTLPMNEIVLGLNKTQPEVLQSTPTIVYKLCQEVMLGRLKIDPVFLFVGGEPLYKPIRALIKKVWPKIYLYNMFSALEGLYAFNCKADSHEMHLTDDACIIEPVNKEGLAVKKGIMSEKIYLTNLYSYTLPLIRYESADKLLFLDKECSCGIKHQLIAEPDGRPEFDFYYNEIYVHHLIFVTHLLLEENIREYQVTQTEQGANIKIKTIGLINEERLTNSITTELRQLGLVQPQVNLLKVDHFDYLPSGKLRRFIKLKP